MVVGKIHVGHAAGHVDKSDACNGQCSHPQIVSLQSPNHQDKAEQIQKLTA
jgi:hypothetical protein